MSQQFGRSLSKNEIKATDPSNKTWAAAAAAGVGGKTKRADDYKMVLQRYRVARCFVVCF
jgi:hypothetical protein